MEALICLTIGIVGTFIHIALQDIIAQMKIKNDLLKKQNDILKEKK